MSQQLPLKSYGDSACFVECCLFSFSVPNTSITPEGTILIFTIFQTLIPTSSDFLNTFLAVTSGLLEVKGNQLLGNISELFPRQYSPDILVMGEVFQIKP